MFNIIYMKIPQEWKNSMSVSVFKKGDITNPASYRGITLLSISLNFFTKIIADRITSIVPINEEQQGFRENRSTTDALFIIKQVVENSF